MSGGATVGAGSSASRLPARSATTTLAEQQETTLRRGFVGQSVPRKEDRRLLQGQGLFVDDFRLNGVG